MPEQTFLDIRHLDTGYNRSFLYPAKHGIATLSSGLASLVDNLVTNARVVEIEVRQAYGETAGTGRF